MAFTQNHFLHIPELAVHLGLTSPEFRVEGILRGGMGECIRIVQQEKSFGCGYFGTTAHRSGYSLRCSWSMWKGQ
jgi:hypothetical protein